jgi:enoyl-[acyl-carrier protein] reductase I
MFLTGKKILITGLLSSKSIAYGIAKICKAWGAELAFSYANERFKDRVSEFAEEFGSQIVLPCDVGSDQDIENLFIELQKHWPKFDGLVHSIAFADKP